MKFCPQCETGYHDQHSTCPTHGGLLSEIRDLKPGMLIRGTYRIKSKLGKGGMGSVYLAQHTLLDEPRALKFLSQDLSEDESFTSRFLHEVRTLRQVRNRHVVDCGDPERAEDDSLFFSMEYVDGPNLREYLKTAPPPFDVKLALHITRGIAEGLGAAHAKGMVHRDIKPENILLAKDGDEWVPKIADFGIVATKHSSQQTRTGSVLLSMAYAAPEQWTGTRAADLDGRTDLYALGGVLFEMLTGQCAFDAENYHGWAQLHIHTPPPAPSTRRADLRHWLGLDELVMKMMAKERADRPQNVAELTRLIDAVVYDPTRTTVLAPAAADPWGATAIYVPTSGPHTVTPPAPQFPIVHASTSAQEAATSLQVPASPREPPAPCRKLRPPCRCPPRKRPPGRPFGRRRFQASLRPRQLRHHQYPRRLRLPRNACMRFPRRGPRLRRLKLRRQRLVLSRPRFGGVKIPRRKAGGRRRLPQRPHLPLRHNRRRQWLPSSRRPLKIRSRSPAPHTVQPLCIRWPALRHVERLCTEPQSSKRKSAVRGAAVSGSGSF